MTPTREKPTPAQASVELRAPTSVTFSALEAPASGVKAKPRRFAMDAYTGAAFDHPYLGRAVIDVEGITCAEGGCPALRQHRPELFVGRCEKVVLAEGRVGVEGFLFDGVEAADEVARISDQGGKWQASVKVDPNVDAIDYLGADSTATVNGVALSGPLAILRESTLTECSFVPRGADTATSALALSSQPAATPQVKKEPSMDPVTAERQRVAEIRKAFPKHVNFALEQIEKGVTLAEAKAAFADVVLAESETALAAATARAEAAEKKAAEATRQAGKPSHASELGAPGAGAPAGAGVALSDDDKDPIKRWDVALAVEIDRLARTGMGEVEELGARRAIALSAEANRRALAVANLSQRDPALRAAYVEAYNARGIGSRTRNNKAR